ncbi:MAG: HIT domain-containing protein [Thermoguttaceae bacterium]
MDHQRIWAPWRLSYIVGDVPAPEPAPPPSLLPGGAAECFLCRGVAEGDDRQRLVVGRNGHSITMLNRYPYNNGHLLVAPRRHVAGLDQLEPGEQLDLMQTIARMIRLLGKVLKPEGFNVGLNLGRAAGAGLPGHLHWHIVPRWAGDTNFMPVLAGIRVIPQSLEALWQALGEALKD